MKQHRLLVIDACGETTGIVAGLDGNVVAARELPRGRGSAEIVEAVSDVLEAAGWDLHGLHAVAVVSGPGSFTGVRVGLAAAKGLCEAAGVRMVAVSRLQVLMDMAGDSFAVGAFDAGRGEVYAAVRQADGSIQEQWTSADALRGLAAGYSVAVGDAKLLEALGGVGTVFSVGAADALRTVIARMGATEVDDVLAEANYVRREGDIYAKLAAGSVPHGAGS